MSFAKALTLLRLAEMAAARHAGVSLSQIEAHFEVDRRTAQRMTKALEEIFPDCSTSQDAERRKLWKIPAENLRLVLSQGIRDGELAALDMAIRRAMRDGDSVEADALESLRDRLLSAMPRPHARRAEADAEALLEAYGFASRPGPRVRPPAVLLGAIAQALKGPHLLTIDYRGASDGGATARLVEPHGLLLGTRPYLVARPHQGDGVMRHYRVDRIAAARLEASSFARDPDFDLAAHAARAFGSFHADEEWGEVVWRFAPEAAAVASDFVFHPGQEMARTEDGGLEVRFRASGWLEMAWHLYQWGDAVEVLQPAELRRMVSAHRRGDFPALP